MTMETRNELAFEAHPFLSRHVPDQEFQDNVHGFIQLSSAEVAVLDHPAVVRLKTVKQFR